MAGRAAGDGPEISRGCMLINCQVYIARLTRSGGDKFARVSTNLSYWGNFRVMKISRFLRLILYHTCKSYREQINAKSSFEFFAKFTCFGNFP